MQNLIKREGNYEWRFGCTIIKYIRKNNIDLNQVLENFNQSKQTNESSSENNNPPNESSIDPEMIIKIQKLLSLMNNNKNSKDEQLLQSLKPYMRQSRKDKIDQYIKLLHIMKLFENFQEMGGNLNDFL